MLSGFENPEQPELDSYIVNMAVPRRSSFLCIGVSAKPLTTSLNSLENVGASPSPAAAGAPGLAAAPAENRPTNAHSQDRKFLRGVKFDDPVFLVISLRIEIALVDRCRWSIVLNTRTEKVLLQDSSPGHKTSKPGHFEICKWLIWYLTKTFFCTDETAITHRHRTVDFAH